MEATNTYAECIYSHLSGDPDLGDIVAMFVEEMPKRVSIILDHLNKAEMISLRRDAHQLRGAAGSYGFDPISPCASRVENAIRDGESEERIREAVMELVDLCGRLQRGRPS